jgi:hypothetical protein
VDQLRHSWLDFHSSQCDESVCVALAELVAMDFSDVVGQSCIVGATGKHLQRSSGETARYSHFFQWMTLFALLSTVVNTDTKTSAHRCIRILGVSLNSGYCRAGRLSYSFGLVARTVGIGQGNFEYIGISCEPTKWKLRIQPVPRVVIGGSDRNMVLVNASEGSLAAHVVLREYVR